MWRVNLLLPLLVRFMLLSLFTSLHLVRLHLGTFSLFSSTGHLGGYDSLMPGFYLSRHLFSCTPMLTALRWVYALYLVAYRG